MRSGERIERNYRRDLLANHGTIAVGASVGEAYSRTELLEEMVEIYCRARVAREPSASETG